MTSMILQRRRNSTPKLLRADYESKKTGPLPTTTTTYNTTGSEVDNMPHWGRVTDECADDEGTTTKIAVWMICDPKSTGPRCPMQRREHHHEQDPREEPAGEVEFDAPPEPPTEEELRREEEEPRGRPDGFVSLGEESDDESDHRPQESPRGEEPGRTLQESIERLVEEQRELRKQLLEQQNKLAELRRDRDTGREFEPAIKRRRESERSVSPLERSVHLAPREERERKSSFRALPRDVARVNLCQCESKAELMAHMEHQELILAAYGMGDYSGKDGSFVPHAELEILLLSEVAESLREIGLATEAQTWIREQRVPRWAGLKEMLRWRHCRRHHLQDYFHKAVAEFRCDNSGQIESFLAQLRRAYTLLVSVYTDDVSERKRLVRQAIGALPNLVEREVIRKLQDLARERGDCRDWEEVRSLTELETTIREAALTDEAAYRTRRERKADLSSGGKHPPSGQGRNRDQVRATGAQSSRSPRKGAENDGEDDADLDQVQKTIDEMEAERKAHNESKSKEDREKASASARDGERERFAKRFGLCLFVTAPWNYKEARIYHDFGSDDLLAQTDKKGRTYYLLGYENRSKGEDWSKQAVENNPQYRSREYTLRGKN
ncbi:hypothetical protein FOZ60_001272 [Perkinsus olseni]|uniref:Uncharacterized protein n=1 Tax=Perkinsus olseni TaxID=32597 RepID=A0A7J6P0J3_PEROL|nr:hypothetical protein FOZ60_001272 [Perkinsus olseni]